MATGDASAGGRWAVGTGGRAAWERPESNRRHEGGRGAGPKRINSLVNMLPIPDRASRMEKHHNIVIIFAHPFEGMKGDRIT